MKDNLSIYPEFPSCRRCYATLGFYSISDDPEVITRKLNIAPTKTISKGGRKKLNVWLLTSEDEVDSKDIRSHIYWICGKLESKCDILQEIHEVWENKMHCYWESESGNGGPILDARLISYLSNFGFEVHFDLWFPE